MFGNPFKFLEILASGNLPFAGFGIKPSGNAHGADLGSVETPAFRAGVIWRVNDSEVEGVVGQRPEDVEAIVVDYGDFLSS